MAFYISNRRWVNSASGFGEIIDYTLDTPADIAGLPVNGTIKEGSTALIQSTSDVYLLVTGGWKAL